MESWFIQEVMVGGLTLPFFYIITLWFHELGHALEAEKVLGEKVPIQIGWKYWSIEVPDNISATYKIEIIRQGILLGFFPVVFYFVLATVFGFSWSPFILLFAYFFGCLDDFKQWRGLENGLESGKLL